MSAQIRPEFQLIEVAKSYKAQSGYEVQPGTIVGRLYFPAGYKFGASNIKMQGILLYDSWKTTAKAGRYTSSKKTRVVEFVATAKLVEYFADETRSVASNMAANRMRTVALANRLLKSQVQAVKATPARKSRITSRAVELVSANPQVQVSVSTPIRASMQLCLPAVSSFVAPVEPAPIYASDWNDEELWAMNMTNLKKVAKKLGLKVATSCRKADLIAAIKQA